MAVYELQSRMVLPEYGNGTKKVQEFFLTEQIWDDMTGTYVEEPFQSFPVINDLNHLRNFITYHHTVVYCPQSDVAFDSDDLPKNKSLKHL
jgi:hypothetical protein